MSRGKILIPYTVRVTKRGHAEAEVLHNNKLEPEVLSKGYRERGWDISVERTVAVL